MTVALAIALIIFFPRHAQSDLEIGRVSCEVETLKDMPEPVLKAVRETPRDAQNGDFPHVSREEVRRAVREAFPHDPRMLEVIGCESNFRQFNRAGEPLVSHTGDYGVAQINERVWDATAERLGLDYKHSLEDNLKMAQYVYSAQGIGAWVCFDLI